MGVLAGRKLRGAVLGGALVLAAIVTAQLLLWSDGRTPVAVAGEPGWSIITPSDGDVFSELGPTYLSSILPWGDQLVVLGRVLPLSDTEHSTYAWLTSDGLHWEHRRLALGGCDLFDGVVVRGREIVVPCHTKTSDGDWVVSVASTTDLVEWQVHPVKPGQAARVALGPAGTVVVVTHGDHADAGGPVQVWASRDLVHWTDLVATAPAAFVGGSVTGIYGDGARLVLVGSTGERDAAGARTARAQPSVWTKTAGRPFRRVFLGPVPGGASVGQMSAVTATRTGWVAVGDGWAWTSPDLSAWEPNSEGLPVRLSGGATWVHTRPDGTILAGGDEAWLSTDDGHSWGTAGIDGPSAVTEWKGRVFGLSHDRRIWLWTDLP